jgi:ABC-type glycerol-3-phosphate transport system substrate-binding protein
MKRIKKLVIIGVIAIVVLGGILGGVAIASADEPTTTTTEATAIADINTLAEKVAAAYEANTGVAIDAQELVKAFEQVRQDVRSEALDNYLDKLVQDGKITAEQAQQFKDWIDARPDVPIGPGANGGCSGRFGGGFRGMMRGGFGGMMHGWFAPDTTNTQ